MLLTAVGVIPTAFGVTHHLPCTSLNPRYASCPIRLEEHNDEPQSSHVYCLYAYDYTYEFSQCTTLPVLPRIVLLVPSGRSSTAMSQSHNTSNVDTSLAT